MINGQCQCGAVEWDYAGIPPKLTSCNCSICRRIGGLWAYGTRATIRVKGVTDTYVQGDRTLAYHRCATCGCTTHWIALEDSGAATRIAVNMRMADPDDYATIRIRRFDGADTWEFLD